ncbi:hypothetical protein KIL84_023429 [Mauremys mutica]|uniref:Uncharacterized protein n=1 Tax=Mauremys mutica TaxID=74926 RepID=A0A9D4ARN7_9SAUR|nr:hypothetical protein KIL84_023429 [Mauremys mutica]
MVEVLVTWTAPSWTPSLSPLLQYCAVDGDFCIGTQPPVSKSDSSARTNGTARHPSQAVARNTMARSMVSMGTVAADAHPSEIPLGGQSVSGSLGLPSSTEGEINGS